MLGGLQRLRRNSCLTCSCVDLSVQTSDSNTTPKQLPRVNEVRRHTTRFQHRFDSKSGRLERRFSLAPSMSQVLPTTSRVVLRGKVHQMHALSFGVPFGQWADLFRCCALLHQCGGFSVSTGSVSVLSRSVSNITSKAHVDTNRVPVVAFVLVRGQQALCESLFGHSPDMVQKE